MTWKAARLASCPMFPDAMEFQAMTTKKTTKAHAMPKNKSEATKAKAAPKEAASRKPSAVSAAVRVLEESREPMTCQELIEQMAAKKYWSSPKGKTPAATLYAAILREIKTQGTKARFKKVARGKFARA